MKLSHSWNRVLLRTYFQPRRGDNDVHLTLEIERKLTEIRAGALDHMITPESIAELRSLSRSECVRLHGSLELRDAVLARAKMLEQKRDQ